MKRVLSSPEFCWHWPFVPSAAPASSTSFCAFHIGGWVGYARLVREQVLAARERDFVKPPAPSAPRLRIIVRHIFAQHHSASNRSACDRHGWSHPRRATMSFLRSPACRHRRQVGAPCSTTAAPPVRRSHPRALSRARGDAGVLSFNFIGTPCAIISTHARGIEAGL